MTQFELATRARGEAQIDALNAEFGSHLASRIIEDEALDFIWEARVSERYVGQYPAADYIEIEAQDELSKVAVVSNYGLGWRVGMCLVDGDGAAVELLWQQPFSSLHEAQAGLARAH